jgi:hypothetical protein
MLPYRLTVVHYLKAGQAKENGLVPSAGDLPPCGVSFGNELLKTIPIISDSKIMVFSELKVHFITRKIGALSNFTFF